MRIALFSDIHGNVLALDAVLDDIAAQGGVDRYWCLGDLVALGPDPIGVLERLDALANAFFCRGNTDRYATTPSTLTVEDIQRYPRLLHVAQSIAWTKGAVTVTGWRPWLSSLSIEQRLTLPDGTRLLGVHASPGQDDGTGLHPGLSETQISSCISGCDVDLVCVGHTHWPMDLTVDGVRLVNVGSVSNPLPPDLRAGYVLLEADETGYRLYHRRVPYDREAVVGALQWVGYPGTDYIARFMRGENEPGWQ
ncbi:MAG: metallophosphoesterase family protein [Anaerolineae bacterium]|nr:metallophosphoesterase family protein [Anaerolineae bacterium]